MQFGAKLDNYGPHVANLGVAEPARRAELAGFDSIWCSDHVVMPATVRSAYPSPTTEASDGTRSEPWYDAVVWCAAIAVVTERVEFGTAVMLAGLRHPLVLAKQLASIDALSGGRMIAGFGAGWMSEEFDALGVPFESRGGRLDEWIDICRQVWTGRVRDSMASSSRSISISSPSRNQPGGSRSSSAGCPMRRCGGSPGAPTAGCRWCAAAVTRWRRSNEASSGSTNSLSRRAVTTFSSVSCTTPPIQPRPALVSMPSPAPASPT